MSLKVQGWSFVRLTDPTQVDDFWRLCTDAHVRRYLLDGEELPRSWAASATATSSRLFAEGSAGLWLGYRPNAAHPTAFTGFWSFEELGPEPQLLYAMTHAESGRGDATRFGEALIDWARRESVFEDIVSAVDEPNAASIRVLRKLGFQDDGEKPGAFGSTCLFRLPRGRPPLTMHTDRLILRPWKDTDLAPFAAMNADPQVRRFFPDVMSREASDDFASKIRTFMADRGWGLWAVEEQDGAPFIGFVGLAMPSFDAPFDLVPEIGWRLAGQHWGKGYATEAAARVLDAAFVHLGLNEVISMTAVTNAPSRRVMEKIGMRHDPRRDFDHPNVPDGHELRPHVLYFATAK